MNFSKITTSCKTALCVVFALLLATLQSCKDDEITTNDLKRQAVRDYADLVLANYDDAYNTAVTLNEKINAFVTTPSAANLTACKDAWKAARIPYGQTEAFRFYGGPIDDEDGPEGLINAWPIDESFIDYVEGNVDGGLINDPDEYPTISKEVLEDLNESISEASIFTGYHAIEFLLWGQDFSTDGPGNRSYSDYVSGQNGTNSNQERRGEYLKVVSELLLDNLEYVRDAWKSGAPYRESFVNNSDIDLIINNIFTGIGELSKGELAGERMFVAVDTEDQENEHSCFSDNTHVDIKMNFLGVKNVYYTTYKKVDGSTFSGKSFGDIVKSLSKEKSDAVDAAFVDAEAKINLIPAPFDQAILNNADEILDAVESLGDLSDALVDAGFELESN